MNKEQIINFLSSISHQAVLSSDQSLEFQLWNKNEIESNNRDYNVEEFLPGYLGIGTSGGGEMLCVEFSSGKCFAVPFIPMLAEDRIEIANSLESLELL